MAITNWFSVAAGGCFLAATIYAVYSGQPLKLILLYALLAVVNYILGTL